MRKLNIIQRLFLPYKPAIQHEPFYTSAKPVLMENRNLKFNRFCGFIDNNNIPIWEVGFYNITSKTHDMIRIHNKFHLTT